MTWRCLATLLLFLYFDFMCSMWMLAVSKQTVSKRADIRTHTQGRREPPSSRSFQLNFIVAEEAYLLIQEHIKSFVTNLLCYYEDQFFMWLEKSRGAKSLLTSADTCASGLNGQANALLRIDISVQPLPFWTLHHTFLLLECWQAIWNHTFWQGYARPA